MTTAEFREFVRAHEVWFRGRLPETAASIAAAERTLAVRLPDSVRWLLTEYGYWHGTAISSLGASVQDTLRAREKLRLPEKFVVLRDLQDAGVILLDTGEESSPGEAVVYWVGYEELGPEPSLRQTERYASYGAYLASILPEVQDEIGAEDARYDPNHYPEGRRGRLTRG